jgi:hypothetical protein
MTRICAIGDSHIGPLRDATLLENFPKSDEVVFFAAFVGLMPALTLEGRKLVAGTAELAEMFRRTSRGFDYIDIDRFDRIILIGMGFGMLPTASIYYHYVSDFMSSPPPGKYLISDACYLEIAERRHTPCEALRLVRLIRSVSDVPITLVPGPNPGEGLARERIMRGAAPYHEIVRNGDDAAMAALFRQVCARIGEKLRITVLPPIPEVAANGVLNKRAFSKLPETLDPSPAVDYNDEMFHAGGDYCRYLAYHLFDMEVAAPGCGE